AVASTGKFEVVGDAGQATAPEIFSGPTLILGPKGCFLFANAVEYGDRAYKVPTHRNKGKLDPSAHFSVPYDHDEYVMWGFSARREKFALPENPEAVDGEELKAAVAGRVHDWHPGLRSLGHRAGRLTL